MEINQKHPHREEALNFLNLLILLLSMYVIVALVADTFFNYVLSE